MEVDMKCPKCGYTDEIKTNESGGMRIPPRISDIGLELVKSFEGKYNKAYLCPAGKWTIGYGHTGETLGKPTPQGMTITDKQVDELLKQDMNRFEDAVIKNVKVKLLQQQFDALVSFAFNVGSGALASSTLLKKLNAGDYTGAADQFLVWNKATVNGKKTVLAGLTRRRQAERHLFLTGELKTNF